MTTTQEEAIARHGRKLLVIFPNATERDPVKLCKKLRALEKRGAAFALRLCNGPEYPSPEAADRVGDAILAQVNALLGNVREYQPKTGAKCSCKRGQQRDNCPACEGTGMAINFAKIRAARPLVPIFVNRDPRGYCLKIDDEYTRANKLDIGTDWGGYGIIAPEIDKDGHG
jgi:hypothetical protein